MSRRLIDLGLSKFSDQSLSNVNVFFLFSFMTKEDIVNWISWGCGWLLVRIKEDLGLWEAVIDILICDKNKHQLQPQSYSFPNAWVCICCKLYMCCIYCMRESECSLSKETCHLKGVIKDSESCTLHEEGSNVLSKCVTVLCAGALKKKMMSVYIQEQTHTYQTMVILGTSHRITFIYWRLTPSYPQLTGPKSKICPQK